MALTLHSIAFCLGNVASLPRNSLTFRQRTTVRASGFSFPRFNVKGKVFPGDGLPQTEESPLVVCFGEMLIDFVPTTSGISLAEAPAFKKAPGGAPANVAVGIARLGGSSAFIGKVGEDEFGYMLADILKENNVNNQGMRFDPGARTALAFVTLRSDGERKNLSLWFYKSYYRTMQLSPHCCSKSCKGCWCGAFLRSQPETSAMAFSRQCPEFSAFGKLLILSRLVKKRSLF